MSTRRTGRSCTPTTSGGAFPNLEIREDVLADTTNTVTINRADLLAAVNTAHQLTTDSHQPRLRLQPAGASRLHVVLHADSGGPSYTTHLAVQRVAGPVPTPTVNPAFARDAVAFLDGDHIDIHATGGRLPIYLAGHRRHAIVTQVAT